MNDLLHLSKILGQTCQTHNVMLATAESCTGGLVADSITAIAGSSAWFERGFVTYSNKAKQEMLGVQAAILERYGAVSKQTAIEMAVGALKYSHAQLSVAITGIAGPDGGSVEKPVGTVWFAWASVKGNPLAQVQRFNGDRTAVRLQAAAVAMTELTKMVNSYN